MQVETYQIETASGELFATEEERQQIVELAEQLALQGQQTLINSESGTIFPFRLMTQAEKNVYGLLLPERTLVSEFKESIMPLRVLQILAHVKAVDDERLGHLEVWHQPSDKDPVLVASKNRWESDKYILARWGDDLESFATLQDRARKLAAEKVRAWAASFRSKLEATTKCCDDLTLQFVTGETADWKPDVYRMSS